ncbi:MAG: nickel-dependent hydrogenase large subunit, partial [Acidobacteriota bacterium]
ETLFVALRPERSSYGFRGDTICTSGGSQFGIESYRDAVREFTVEHSTARHAALESGETYMVGSLARLKLWGDRLEGRARAAFRNLFPGGVTDNILTNTRAQVVETVYCVESAISHCEQVLDFDEIGREMQPVEARAGRGVGAIEAPRGTLFHEFELDERGKVVAANIVTPTAQNLANIERDIRNSGTRLHEASISSDSELKRGFEMVARAYDPCISCSVHLVRVDD